jgi:hypothetical protein
LLRNPLTSNQGTLAFAAVTCVSKFFLPLTFTANLPKIAMFYLTILRRIQQTGELLIDLPL